MGPSAAVHAAPGGEARERAPADISALLVELGRAARSLQLYPSGHPARKEHLERAWQAWQGELGRHGPVAVEVRRGAFWMADGDVAVGRGRLEELARELALRGLRRLEVTPELDLAAFEALSRLLLADPDELLAAGGVERAFHARGYRGVRLNEADPAAWLEARATREPEAEAALGADDTTVPEIPPFEAACDDAPGADEDPAHELEQVLEALAACTEATRYAELATRATALAIASAADADPAAAHRVLEVFGTHARADRAEPLREAAREARCALALAPPVLDDLLRRASAPSGEASLRACQLLVSLGSRAAGPILDAFVAARDGAARGALAGVLIALGPAATPALEQALAGEDEAYRRAAARLAGESRASALVPALRRQLDDPDEALRRDAARALVQIGDERAFEALVSMLPSRTPGVAELGAFCVGATGRIEAIRPLVQMLDRALAERDVALGLEAVRALGRLGRAEGAAPLAALLRRRSFRFRTGLRELHACAVESLARLPGARARSALVSAATHPTREVRELAGRLLERANAATLR